MVTKPEEYRMTTPIYRPQHQFYKTSLFVTTIRRHCHRAAVSVTVTHKDKDKLTLIYTVD